MTEYDEHWISTMLVPRFYFLDPKPEDIYIEDIAHALSMLCRFGGHSNRFYSVAEHSVQMCYHLWLYDADRDYQLAALLHDAEEAYLPDIPRPVKAMMPEAKKIYQKLNLAILSKFKVRSTIDWSLIKDFDNRMCITEAQQLGVYHRGWSDLGRPFPYLTLSRWSPKEAEDFFLVLYKELTNDGRA